MVWVKSLTESMLLFFKLQEEKHGAYIKHICNDEPGVPGPGENPGKWIKTGLPAGK